MARRALQPLPRGLDLYGTGGTALESPHNHSIAGSKPVPAVCSDFGEGKSQLAGLAAGWFATVKHLSCYTKRSESYGRYTLQPSFEESSSHFSSSLCLHPWGTGAIRGHPIYDSVAKSEW